MCGITGYLCKESVPSKEVIETLLIHAASRGTDAVGYTIIGKNDGYFGVIDSEKKIGLGDVKAMSQSIVASLNIGDIIIANHRAAPETEVESVGNESIQPIMDEDNGVILVHNGAVSNFIYDELINDYDPISSIDSEAIIWAYIHHGRNMKRTMEFLSGGFAFLLVDIHKEKLYAVATHNPLYAGYVRGHGMAFSSVKEGIYSVISEQKGTTISRNNVAIWEDYYCQEIPANSITEIDCASGMRNEMNFTPRYIHPNWDPLKHRSRRRKILVAASGGLDSTTTLVVLKEAGYDVTAVHFQYGHRGEECETEAIIKITNKLDIQLEVFDLRDAMSILDSKSMLTDPEHEITTGTEQGLKATVAWTCFRNGFFTTYMGALAESLIINSGYGEVYITGGFMNLTESGVYPDNSERFINSFSKFANFASIAGKFIKPLYGCANLLKTEQYMLLNELGYLEDLSPHLISCDRPKMIDGKPHNCSKDGKPACGSGLLSWWACKLAGTEDHRLYYEVDDENYVAYEPNSNFSPKQIKMEDILKKLQLHPINLKILQRKISR